MSITLEITGTPEDLEIFRQRVEEMVIAPAQQNRMMGYMSRIGKGQEIYYSAEGYKIFYSYNNAVMVEDGDKILVSDKKFKRPEVALHLIGYIAGREYVTVPQQEIEKYFPMNR